MYVVIGFPIKPAIYKNILKFSTGMPLATLIHLAQPVLFLKLLEFQCEFQHEIGRSLRINAGFGVI